MANCLLCGKWGGLFSMHLTADKICTKCVQRHMPEIESRCRVIGESGKIVEDSKNIDTRLSRIDVAIQNLESLVPYERKGVATLSEPPSKAIKLFEEKRKEIIGQYIREQKHGAREKSKDASTASAKLTPYAKAVERLTKLMDGVEDISELQLAIAELRMERDAVRFEQLMRKGDAALAKGSEKSALSSYVDAYIALKDDTTPDAKQKDKLEQAKSKIIDLGGTVPD